MRELRDAFSLLLPAKLRELDEAVRLARVAPADRPAWERAHLIAHRLRGTAGSYGFDEEGETAGVIEDALEVVAQDDPSARDRAWADIAGALEKLAAR
jgi:chemotaxis protein histidine kinase CheA